MTKFAQPLQIKLGPSLRLAVFAGLVHVLAAVSVAFTPGLQGWRLPLIALITTQFGCFFRRQVTAGSRWAVSSIAWDKERGWRVASAAGDWRAVRPEIPVFVSFRLVVVRFRVSTCRRRSVVIVADRLGADDFRRLRVLLLQTALNPSY